MASCQHRCGAALPKGRARALSITCSHRGGLATRSTTAAGLSIRHGALRPGISALEVRLVVGGREGIAAALSSTVRAPRWLHLVSRSLSPCSCSRHSIVQTARQCRRSERLIDWSRVEIGCSLCGSACDARAEARSAVATTVVRGRTRAVLWPISQIPRRRYIASSDPCPSGGNRDRLYSHALRRRRRRCLPDGCSVRATCTLHDDGAPSRLYPRESDVRRVASKPRCHETGAGA